MAQPTVMKTAIIFEYDISELLKLSNFIRYSTRYFVEICLGEDLPNGAKIDFNNFLDKAWVYKMRVCNWPANGQFPKHDVTNVGNLTVSLVCNAVIPQIEDLEYQYASQTNWHG